MKKEPIILDGHKLMWHPDRLDAWERNERIVPVTIDMALTRACTYNCQYCYGKLQVNESRAMSWENIQRFLEDAADLGVRGISLVGDGESTCSPYLNDAIEYGYNLGIDMALGTNGYLLREIPRILSRLTYLRFNISAATPETYARIHGCTGDHFYEVQKNIMACVEWKKRSGIDTTIGLQMVLMPHRSEDVLPLVEYAKRLRVDYLVIKHCSDDEFGHLGIDYSKYPGLKNVLEKAEKMSTPDCQIAVKWSKILSGGVREYSRCFGPQFILQISGSGLVAPCGMLFNDRYKDDFHIGNITTQRFRDIWESDRYMEVMQRLGSNEFDAKTMCGTLCLQHHINCFLNQGLPQHVNFV